MFRRNEGRFTSKRSFKSGRGDSGSFLVSLGLCAAGGGSLMSSLRVGHVGNIIRPVAIFEELF